MTDRILEKVSVPDLQLSKLHKKDPNLHVATTFSLKQGETRISHGPIPHPLKSTVECYLPKIALLHLSL